MRTESVRELEDLWTRFLSGGPLGVGDRAALTAAISSDDVLHRRLLYDLRLDGALRAASEADADGETAVRAITAKAAAALGMPEPEEVRSLRPPPSEQPRRRARATALLAMAGAAAAVVVLLAVWHLRGLTSQTSATRSSSVETTDRRLTIHGASNRETPTAEPGARIGAVDGVAHVYARSGPVRPMTDVRVLDPGDWIAIVGSQSRVRIEYQDGTDIELAGDVVATGFGARPRDSRIFVARGRLRVSLPPDVRVPAMEVASPHAVITADGCFRLDVSAEETRVEVQRRRVRVASLSTTQTTEVPTGYFTIARGDELLGAAPVRLPGAEVHPGVRKTRSSGE
jgi:ferric-dicitrate binding protein FerR (iron transport regulator)